MKYILTAAIFFSATLINCSHISKSIPPAPIDIRPIALAVYQGNDQLNALIDAYNKQFPDFPLKDKRDVFWKH